VIGDSCAPETFVSEFSRLSKLMLQPKATMDMLPQAFPEQFISTRITFPYPSYSPKSQSWDTFKEKALFGTHTKKSA
jgi:hypothetical protein